MILYLTQVATWLAKITLSWEQTDGVLHMAVTIPANSTAEVWVPSLGGGYRTEPKGPRFLRLEGDYAVLAVGSGTYEFTSGNLVWDGYGELMPSVDEGAVNSARAGS